jgi:NADH-quinone oxidoreductase subunit L
MTLPLVVLGVLSAIGGLVLNPVHSGPLYRFLAPVTVGDISGLGYTPVGPLGEPQLIAISIVAVAIGITLAWLGYARRDLSRGRMVDPVRGPLAELMERKFLVDEAYEAVFVTFGTRVARVLTWFDRTHRRRGGDGLRRLLDRDRTLARRAQTGMVRSYVTVMVVASRSSCSLVVWMVR